VRAVLGPAPLDLGPPDMTAHTCACACDGRQGLQPRWDSTSTIHCSAWSCALHATCVDNTLCCAVWFARGRVRLCASDDTKHSKSATSSGCCPANGRMLDMLAAQHTAALPELTALTSTTPPGEEPPVPKQHSTHVMHAQCYLGSGARGCNTLGATHVPVGMLLQSRTSSC
jgi:hypothetical protein